MKNLFLILLVFVSLDNLSQENIRKLDEVVIKTNINLDSFLDSLFVLNGRKNQLIKYNNSLNREFKNSIVIEKDTLLYINDYFNFFLKEKSFVKTQTSKIITNFEIIENKRYKDNFFTYKFNNVKFVLPREVIEKKYFGFFTGIMYKLEKERKKFSFFKENINDDFKVYFKVKKDIGVNYEGYLLVDKLNYVIKKIEFRLNNSLKSILKIKDAKIKSQFEVLEYYGTVTLKPYVDKDKYYTDETVLISKLKFLKGPLTGKIVDYNFFVKKSEIPDSLFVEKFDFNNYVIKK